MATPTSNSISVDSKLQLSYVNEIDSLLKGMKWGLGLGFGVTLTYSFPSGFAYFDTNYGFGFDLDASEWYAGWSQLNTTQQSAFKSALLTYSNVANITFVEVDDNSTTVGEIRVAMSKEVDTIGLGGFAYYPNVQPSSGDIWLSPNNFLYDPITLGSFEFQTLIHELGHAVGLSHPFDGESVSGASVPTWLDNVFYTVMSYTRDPSGNEYSIDRYPETPMLLDIQALQYLYGANTQHNAGDTTYAFTGTGKYFETIWDGGGSDTIDYMGSNTGATVDLREGAWSSLGQPIVFTNSYGVQQKTDSRTVWIAYGAEIENAVGSQKDDLIYGNELENQLSGYWGTDTIFGFGGDDRLILSLDAAATTAVHDGSPGAPGTGQKLDLSGKWKSLDTYNGGEGKDTLRGGSYNDAILLDSGGSPLLVGIETINTWGGDDVVDLTSTSFGYGNISVYGGDGNDIIWSNAGNDSLYGEAGNDKILGWVGADLISGGAGNDSLFGGSGNDWLSGGSGDDLLDGGDGIDSVVINYLPSQYRLNTTTLSGPEGNDTLAGIEFIRTFLFIGDTLFSTDISAIDFIDPDGSAGGQVSSVTGMMQDITDLYVAYFNRAPDPDGLKYWLIGIENGTLSLEDTAKSFTDQPEYRANYPAGLDNREFISRIYDNLFDRQPDKAGWDYWENDLNNGIPRDTFILTVINGAYDGPSAADKALLNNKHDASMYYTEQLALNPAEGFDANISKVLNQVTADRATVASAMDVIDYAMSDPITVTGIADNQALWDSLWV